MLTSKDTIFALQL